MTTSSVAPRDADSSRDRLSDVSIEKDWLFTILVKTNKLSKSYTFNARRLWRLTKELPLHIVLLQWKCFWQNSCLIDFPLRETIWMHSLFEQSRIPSGIHSEKWIKNEYFQSTNFINRRKFRRMRSFNQQQQKKLLHTKGPLLPNINSYVNNNFVTSNKLQILKNLSTCITMPFPMSMEKSFYLTGKLIYFFFYFHHTGKQ